VGSSSPDSQVAERTSVTVLISATQHDPSRERPGQADHRRGGDHEHGLETGDHDEQRCDRSAVPHGDVTAGGRSRAGMPRSFTAPPSLLLHGTLDGPYPLLGIGVGTPQCRADELVAVVDAVGSDDVGDPGDRELLVDPLVRGHDDEP
jgi:hypothetical protein